MASDAEEKLARWARRQQNVPNTQQAKGARERQIFANDRPTTHTARTTSPSSPAPAFVHEPARQVPVLESCDVLVVGGGPAGMSAAITAARAGADVLIMERYGCFGGVLTTVGMETLAWYRYAGTKLTIG